LYSQIQVFLENIFKQTSSIFPELVLVLGLVVLLFLSLFKKKNTLLKTLVYVAILLGSLLASFYTPAENTQFIEFRRLILLSALFVPLFFSKPAFLSQTNEQAEWLFLMLSGSLGLMMMISASDWVTLFVALELAAIASYILVILSWKKDSYEGAIKYLLFGVLSSAVMVYGVSWLYGFMGTFSFDALLKVHFQNDVLLYMAFFMAIAGLLMKISAVPWHIWTPDAYQVAPVPVVAFLSTAPKIAGLLALYKIMQVYAPVISEIKIILALLAIISIIWGNLVAFWQKNLKRMLAYSSIAQIGYMLMGVVVATDFALESLWFYLVAYVLSNFLVFALAEHYEKHHHIVNIEDFKGLGQKDTWAMVCMLVGLVSLAGLPPTAGFTGKLLLFSALWENYNLTNLDMYVVWLLVGVLNTIVGLFYYIKIPYQAFLKEKTSHTPIKDTYLMAVCIGASIVLVLLFIKPSWILG